MSDVDDRRDRSTFFEQACAGLHDRFAALTDGAPASYIPELATVGIPAKSGVGGGILGVLPGVGGLAVFSPRLDEHGNSVRGIKVFEELSREFEMNLFDPDRPWRRTT